MEANSETIHCTPQDVCFIVPTGWKCHTCDIMVSLKIPDENMQVAIAASRLTTPEDAAADAQRDFDPEFNEKIIYQQDEPTREGWEGIKSFGYESARQMVISSMVFCNNGMCTVLILKGEEAAFERQKANLRVLMQSLRPKGFKPESFDGRRASLFDADKISQLNDFIERSMKSCGIPGIAIGLIQDDQVILSRGFGVREVARPEPVDDETLFLIASNTKQFTTLLLAKLVDEGKLRWETPVRDVLPDFKLDDLDVSEKMQIQHLVSASTGLPRRDMEWMVNFKDATPRSILQLLGTMKPTTKFGSIYQYSNILGAAAGYVAGQALFPNRELGDAYDEAMRAHVFNPLAMKSTTFDYPQVRSSNHARPHTQDIFGSPRRTTIDINPAAVAMRPGLGMWTNIADLMNYVRMELAKGRMTDGSQYMSETHLLRRRQPGVTFEENASYGLGLVVKTKWGIPIVDHGGSWIGYRSNIFWLPEHGIGGAILANADNGEIPIFAFIRKIVELLFDGQPQADQEVAKAMELKKHKTEQHSRSLSIPADAALVKNLATEYSNPALGTLRVAKGANTIFKLGEWQSVVGSHQVNDRVSFYTIDPGMAIFEFIQEDSGGKTILLLRDSQHEYVFIPKH